MCMCMYVITPMSSWSGDETTNTNDQNYMIILN